MRVARFERRRGIVDRIVDLERGVDGKRGQEEDFGRRRRMRLPQRELLLDVHHENRISARDVVRLQAPRGVVPQIDPPSGSGVDRQRRRGAARFRA